VAVPNLKMKDGIKIFCLVALVTLLCNCVLAGQSGHPRFLKEETALTCFPGEGPGKYYYWVGAGFGLAPKCFGIDPNNRTFYIPEVDPYDNIRVHKFDQTGKFISMLKFEGKADVVSNVAISPDGYIYLCLGVPGYRPAECVAKYDREGKLVYNLGAKGVLTEKELNLYADEPLSRKNSLKARGIFPVGSCELFVASGYESDRTIYRFDARTGQLLCKADKLPEDIERLVTIHSEKLEALRKLEHEQKRRTGRVHSVIGPEGEFYYISVGPHKLEIRKVTFHE